MSSQAIMRKAHHTLLSWAAPRPCRPPTPEGARQRREQLRREPCERLGLPWPPSMPRRCVGRPPRRLQCERLVIQHILNNDFDAVAAVTSLEPPPWFTEADVGLAEPECVFAGALEAAAPPGAAAPALPDPGLQEADERPANRQKCNVPRNCQVCFLRYQKSMKDKFGRTMLRSLRTAQQLCPEIFAATASRHTSQVEV